MATLAGPGGDKDDGRNGTPTRMGSSGEEPAPNVGKKSLV